MERCSQKGFTLLETVITIGVMSVVMTTVFVMFNAYLESFDQEYDQAIIERDGSNALEVMKRDIRDANAITTTGCFLVNFTKESDSLDYSYYIQNTTELMRVQGNTCANGEMLTDFVNSTKTSMIYANGVIRIILTLDYGDMTIDFETSVYPRNI